MLQADMDDAAANGAENRTTDTVERVIGRPPIALGTFLAATAAFETSA